MPSILSAGTGDSRVGSGGITTIEHNHPHHHSTLENYEDHNHNISQQPHDITKSLNHILTRQKQHDNLPSSLHVLPQYRLPTLNTNKVCRVCFFVNGDRHFRGLNYVVNLDRVKTLDLLCADLSRILVSVVSLCYSIDFVYLITTTPSHLFYIVQCTFICAPRILQ